MLVSTQDGEIEILLAVSRVESGNLLELIQRGRKRAGLGGHAQLVKADRGPQAHLGVEAGGSSGFRLETSHEADLRNRYRRRR